MTVFAQVLIAYGAIALIVSGLFIAGRRIVQDFARVLPKDGEL